jgi:hypothetical protein
MDALTTIEVHDDPSRKFLVPYLGTKDDSRSNDEARSSLIKIRSNVPTVKGVHTAAHLLFRYWLLDVMADVLDIPPYPNLESVPKATLHTSKNTARLDRVCCLRRSSVSHIFMNLTIQVFGILKDWTSIIATFKRLHTSRLHESNMADAQTTVEPIYNADQQHFQVGLQALRHARNHQINTNYGKILYNVDVLVFCIWWFATVCHVHLFQIST